MKLFVSFALVSCLPSSLNAQVLPIEKDAIKKSVDSAWAILKDSGVNGLERESDNLYENLKIDNNRLDIIRVAALDIFASLMDKGISKHYKQIPSVYFGNEQIISRIAPLMRSNGMSLEQSNKLLAEIEVEVRKAMGQLGK